MQPSRNHGLRSCGARQIFAYGLSIAGALLLVWWLAW